VRGSERSILKCFSGCDRGKLRSAAPAQAAAVAQGRDASRNLPITQSCNLSLQPKKTRKANLSQEQQSSPVTISFLRSLFFPGAMAAATTKAQKIIDDNAVGTPRTPFHPPLPTIHTFVFAANPLNSSRLLKVVLPLLHRSQAPAHRAGRHLPRRRAGPRIRRRGHPGRARVHDVAADRAQHLHRPEAHWRQLGPAGEEGRAAGALEGSGRDIERCFGEEGNFSALPALGGVACRVAVNKY
jgi:hypothetical protein